MLSWIFYYTINDRPMYYPRKKESPETAIGHKCIQENRAAYILLILYSILMSE